MQTNIETYFINLPVFEGPFDLLLFFIERDELDIQNIPIAKITKDFLHYIKSMDSINIDLGSEFIVVAATLMKIKARSLLPVRKSETGQEVEDPQEELIRKILLFKSFKEISTELAELESSRQEKHERGAIGDHIERIKQPVASVSELESASLFHLMQAFEQVMSRLGKEKKKSIHQLIDYPYTIQSAKERIQVMMQEKKHLTFQDIFSECENRIHAIVTFLSILEMINGDEIGIINSSTEMNNFYLIPAEGGSQEEIIHSEEE